MSELGRNAKGEDRGRHLIDYKVDGEPQQTAERQVTANQILSNAGLTVADHYLVQIKGNHQESFKDRGDTILHMHEGMVFVSVFTGPTPVSDPNLTGVSLFAAQLQQLGYTVEDHGDRKLAFAFVVDVGKFAGQQFKLGVQVPADFPLTPPTGPHVSPRLHANQSGGAHPTGGVHDSPFGSDWQYWSRPCNEWPQTRRRVADYLSFLRRLWASQ